ncbi:sensor histidine kinase [Dactylosporangium matsuzakiense]|uniref:histidine kinase n=1 Tax=Dactylosporangium matsuzakiense TaxID=53360 RepID=A0A9W6KC47_9ACTN|nr:sensor domain-containing protein [Dactylosporangium matsuzakiense]UWZ47000.1 sensor domain-containing protein [Dactylosporangium matsuzakiense]GLK98577.1 histidine kinase [Dactylosporangium matsuzakiense]
MASSARGRAALDALARLVGGLATAMLAFIALLTCVVTLLASAAGIGLVVAPFAVQLLRLVADRERDRLSRTGPELLGHLPVPTRVRAVFTDRTVRRELLWAAIHGTAGLFIGVFGIALPVNVLRDGSFPLWYRYVPEEGRTASIGLGVVHSLTGALGVSALALVWLFLLFYGTPVLARAQEAPGRKLLAPPPGTDLMLRVAELTATRAAALDAHATELRRIERALHDGTQNRIVAVSVLLGAARRAVGRDPATADEILERAQSAAEAALADLRAVVRTILPPVLTDRSLPDALRSLAANCAVRVDVDAELPVRCAASVEATAYFVAAEALTNVAKHSGAEHATLRLRRTGDRLHLTVTDDGHGGADEHAGSGLTGIRQRVQAHDGIVELTSPVGGPTTLKVSIPCGS